MGGVVAVPAAVPSNAEPVHPKLGTLDEVLARMKQDVLAGYDVNVKSQRALSWFARAYWKGRHQEDEK